MTRWIALSLGLAVAATALWTLVAGGRSAPARGEIGAGSRAALEKVLAREGRDGAAR